MEWVETMLCQNGQIELLDLHLNRLKWGLYQNNISTAESFINLASKTILSNLPKDSKNYKVRYLLNIDSIGNFSESIESQLLKNFNNEIYQIGIYTEQVKAINSPWNAKITDRNIYQSALNWAKANNLDDALIINSKGHLIETSIFTIFILKDDILYTPPLSDLPVKGVFRTWMIQNSIFPIIEQSLSENDIFSADLILLTNAVRGIRIGKMIQI